MIIIKQSLGDGKDRFNPAATMERYITRQYGIMVWSGIAMEKLLPVAQIRSTMTALLCIVEVLWPVASLYLQYLQSTIFQLDNV